MQSHNDTLTKVVKLLTEQNKKLEHFIPAAGNFWSNFNNSVTYPFILSILSAIVFWLIFSHWPEKNRKNRLRPKVELDMYYVYTELFAFLDLVMTPAERTASSFQDKITGGSMTKDLFELGLFNKCKNDLYKYYPPIAAHQISIGKEQYERVQNIDNTIERVFNFQECLTVGEILLLEKIRKTLQFYPLRYFDENPIIPMNGQILRPVNSSLSYMAQNYTDVYGLFMAYQNVIFTCPTVSDKVFISRVQHLYYSGNWRRCKTVIARPPASFMGFKELLSGYLILCEYNVGNKHEAYELLKEFFKQKPHLVSYRTFMVDLVTNQIVRSILKEYYTAAEIAELKRVIGEDDTRYTDFLQQAEFLKAFFVSQDQGPGP